MKKVLRNYLLASPYSLRTNLKGELTEDLFFEKYFLDMPAFDVTQKRLNEEFGELGIDSGTFFLHGYAGIGKTTFLFWFFKNNLKAYNKIVFNIIDIETDNEGVLPIFDQYFRELLFQLNHNFLNDFDKSLSYIKNMINIMENKFSKLFLDNLLNCDINKESDKRNFIHTIEYQDGLLLFLIFYRLFSKNDFKKIDRLNFIPSTNTSSSMEELPLILAFDNIDHMEIESHNCEFPKKIKRSIDSCSSIIKHEIQLHCIFCLRDANFSLVNRQLEEIVNSKNIPFSSAEHDKIFEKRIEIANLVYCK